MRKPLYKTDDLLDAIRQQPHDLNAAAAIVGAPNLEAFKTACARRGIRPRDAADAIIAGQPVVLFEQPQQYVRVPSLRLKQAAERFVGDIEGAAQAAGYDTIYAYRVACRRAGIDLGSWSLAAQQRDETDAGAGDAETTPWTREQMTELARLWLDRPIVSLADIAQRMGRTPHAIQTVTSRFGFPPRERLTAEEMAKVRREGRIRACMSCGAAFYSAWPGHRICPRHKQTDRTAVDVEAA